MILLAPVTNWEPHGLTLAGYCYAMRHGTKVQIVTPYLVSHLQFLKCRNVREPGDQEANVERYAFVHDLLSEKQSM
jgi:hypothetical protein